jgi:hypothetical protein
VAAAAIAATTAVINAITIILELIGSSTARFGDTLAAVSNFCADHDLLTIYRAVYEAVQGSQHTAKGRAISYAVMDDHDYLNVGCVAPGETIELLFDAASPKLPQFIDHVHSRVRQLANGDFRGTMLFGGYISLRFMTQSEAFLAMQRWPAHLFDRDRRPLADQGHGHPDQHPGGRRRAHGAVLHWGQHNTRGQKDIEQIWSPKGPAGSSSRGAPCRTCRTTVGWRCSRPVH